MRSGHIARLIIVTGAALVTGSCSSPGGVAGISTRPPAPGTGVVADVRSTATATIPPPMPQVVVARPPAEAPVLVPPPRLSAFTYTFPVKGCKTTYENRLLVLPKTTIWAGRGCTFVSPVSGVVDEVNRRNRWKPSTDRGPDREGRFVTVIGDDGVRYLGGHLDTIDPKVKPGLRVTGGRPLGRIGNSGNARSTATNLYFAISWKADPSLWWVRRGMVKPWNYLDAWRNGNRTLSPAEETRAVMKRTGAAPRCATLCAGKSRPTPAPKPTRTPDRKIPLG